MPSPRPAFFVLTGPLILVPLVGVTHSLVKTLGLLLVLGSVGLLHFTIMTVVAPLLRSTGRLLISAIVAAALVTIAGLLLQAHALELYQGLGIYLPLVGVQCLLLQASESERRGNAWSLMHLTACYGATFLLLGLLRELIGQGSLLSNARWLFGSSASGWQIDFFPTGFGVHLAALALGGFIILGLLLAVANALRQRRNDNRI